LLTLAISIVPPTTSYRPANTAINPDPGAVNCKVAAATTLINHKIVHALANIAFLQACLLTSMHYLGQVPGNPTKVPVAKQKRRFLFK
jgi:hypothetical protein